MSFSSMTLRHLTSAHNLRRASILFLFSLLLVACDFTPERSPSPGMTGASDSAPTETITSTVTPTSAAPLSPTSLPPLAVLVKPAETNLSQVDELESMLSDLTKTEGLRFQVRQTLQVQDLNSQIRYVLALPPDPGLVSLASSAPEVQFLGIGIPGLEPRDNLSVISPQGADADEIGFLAGYIAAVVTPEWRVGILSTSDAPADIATRNGFLNGVVYFCGLCRQTYPPYYDYPLYVELPAGSSQAEWQAATDTLRDRFVKTVFVTPSASDQALLEYLAQSEINIIANGEPPNTIQDHWVASIQIDYLQAVREVWPELVTGNGNQKLQVTFQINNVNPNLFSPGRQKLVEEFLNDLQNGYVDTGVDPLTGEIR